MNEYESSDDYSGNEPIAASQFMDLDFQPSTLITPHFISQLEFKQSSYTPEFI